MPMNGEFILGDCLEYLPKYEDNHFDLAIVDPPYGIGNFQQSDGNFKPINWNDEIPNKEYFKELKRVSKNRIIWGANYYNVFESSAIVWDKLNMHPSMSRCEIASCSIGKRVTYFKKEWHGWHPINESIISYHPCMKPVALYKWLLHNYAKEGNLILDTHVGSASSLIACEDMGFEYVGYELDKDYYQAAMKRLQNHIAQLKINYAQ